MPDSRGHRGAHPEDARDFAAPMSSRLRAATFELSFLLGRDFAVDASLKLVGDRHQLSLRQRRAVSRAACSPAARDRRAARRADLAHLRGQPVAIDGFNCLITVEAMLSGAPLFRGRDGALRDLASVHGTYRAVRETEHAAALIAALLRGAGTSFAQVRLDRPVGNSGRTRRLFEHALRAADLEAEVVLSDTVDRDLASGAGTVASSDSWILDHAVGWIDLPSALLPADAWLLDLSEDVSDAGASARDPRSATPARPPADPASRRA